MKLPQHGLTEGAIFDTLRDYRAGDLEWRDGRAFGYVFDAGERADAIGKRAYAELLKANGLDPTAFPSLARLENEIVSMVADHLGGGAETVGCFTSGGTESILLAVKTARDLWRSTHPEGGTPEMLLPVTAHAAFHKGATYFDVKVVPVPVDPETLRADVGAMRAGVNERTALLVGSAPAYAHGVMDPIEAMGALAVETGVPLHVDACMGGFLLPLLRELGEPIPPFDFTLPGVAMISVDLHKYAFCPKGASVLLHRDKTLRRHQIFAAAQWTGYSVVNMTTQSTRSGGPMAAAWAVLNHFGKEGYLEVARQIRDATRGIAAGIRETPGLALMGAPEMSLLAFRSDEVDVFHVADEMKVRGWYVQPQLAFAGLPESIHLTIGPTHAPVVAEFLEDLRASVAAARALPPVEEAKALAATFASIDPATVSDEVLAQGMAMAGLSGAELPERMAGLNAVMNALPAAMRERLLVHFLNDLYTPPR